MNRVNVQITLLYCLQKVNYLYRAHENTCNSNFLSIYDSTFLVQKQKKKKITSTLLKVTQL